MASRAIHRILELGVGVPFLLFGGAGIYADISMYLWVQQDPDHRRAFVGLGTMFGILPFMAGFWLVTMALVRLCSRRSSSQDRA